MCFILFFVKNNVETQNKTFYLKRLVNDMAKRNTPLVPESRDALAKFKMQCAEEIGRLEFVKENNDHYKGDLPSRVNGEQGGPIGGQMVKRMIEMAEKQLAQQ
jgi:hypothetical protein